MTVLVNDGVREITLLGQNVNSYGQDFGDGYRFSSLLRDAAGTGVRRLRFVTSHPKDFTSDVVEAMADHGEVCPSLNLPIQSGSDRMLGLMNRRYRVEDFRRAVGAYRGVFPEGGLTTDLIVGHPGETEEDFQDSLAVLREFRFDLVHSAAYSPREGTAAASWTDQVPREVAMDRLNQVNRLQMQIAGEINRGLIGRTVEVLLDDRAPRGEGLLQGRTRSDKVVLTEAGEELMGRFVQVRIESAESWCLSGTVTAIED